MKRIPFRRGFVNGIIIAEIRRGIVADSQQIQVVSAQQINGCVIGLVPCVLVIVEDSLQVGVHVIEFIGVQAAVARQRFNFISVEFVRIQHGKPHDPIFHILHENTHDGAAHIIEADGKHRQYDGNSGQNLLDKNREPYAVSLLLQKRNQHAA